MPLLIFIITVHWDGCRPDKTGNYHLCVVGWTAGLEPLIFKDRTQRTVLQALMATTVEAVLGAVWMDCKDVEKVKRVMLVLGVVTGVGERVQGYHRHTYAGEKAAKRGREERGPGTIANPINQEDSSAVETKKPSTHPSSRDTSETTQPIATEIGRTNRGKGIRERREEWERQRERRWKKLSLETMDIEKPPATKRKRKRRGKRKGKKERTKEREEKAEREKARKIEEGETGTDGQRASMLKRARNGGNRTPSLS